MLQNGIQFDLTTAIATSTTNACAFEHGESYPAIIAGLWAGKTTWQDQTSDGFAILLLVKDDNGKCVPRAGKFIKCYANYNLYHEKTAFTKLMQGLLSTSSTGVALQKEVINAGYSDISSIIGKPCSVQIALKKSERGTYAVIDDVSRPSSKRPGLAPSDLAPIEVDVRKVFGKYVMIPDLKNASYIQSVIVRDPSEGVNPNAADDYLV